MTQNSAEVERVLVYIEQCRVDLFNLGYAEFTYEDFFVVSSSCIFILFIVVVIFFCFASTENLFFVLTETTSN